MTPFLYHCLKLLGGKRDPFQSFFEYFSSLSVEFLEKTGPLEFTAPADTIKGGAAKKKATNMTRVCFLDCFCALEASQGASSTKTSQQSPKRDPLDRLGD